MCFYVVIVYWPFVCFFVLFWGGCCFTFGFGLVCCGLVLRASIALLGFVCDFEERTYWMGKEEEKILRNIERGRI